MAALVSSEFVSLCQTQLRLLTQQMANSSSAIYIADLAGSDLANRVTDVASGAGRQIEPNFVPIVSWPESIERWVENLEQWNSASAGRSEPLALPSRSQRDVVLPVLPSSVTSGSADYADRHTRQSSDPYEERSYADSLQSDQLQSDQQLVVPLVYAEVVVGLLVSIRRDRSWRHEEQDYIEGVARSLAAGCVLERRNQWLQGQMSDKRALQSRQSEIFHNLLHQFRNPLTAVSTFGQLLVKRLEPEDPNQKIATGIVRESKRLREMVTHFDETVAVGDADLAAEVSPPPLLPATPLSLPHADSREALTENDLDSEALASNVVELSPPDASGLTAGLGHDLTLSAQYLPDIVEPILAVADIVAQEKGVVLEAQVASDIPAVWGEEEALREVVSNLIDNAVKYSPAGARVWVQTGVSRLQYQGIVIGDTGPGIPPDDQLRLFERNYRGVQAESDIPGTGLGLAIAQALMTQMQGFIEVISPATETLWMPERTFAEADFSGPGTVFVVWLLEVER